MASGQNDSNVRRNVDGTERGHYYAVMHRMSKHPRRQWTHGINRTLWRNLRLSFFSIFGLVLNGTTSD